MTTAERIDELDLLIAVIKGWLTKARAAGNIADVVELTAQMDRLLDFRLRLMAQEKKAA
jgi:hypothetical protein